VIALCAIVEVVANPGLTTYTAQQIASKRHAAAQLIPDFLILRLLSSAFAVALLLGAAGFEHRANVRFLLHWYGVGSLLVGLLASDFVLTSLELFHVRSFLSLLQQVLYAIAVLTLVRRPEDIFWVPVSILGSCLLTNLLGWIVLWGKGFRPPTAIDPGRWGTILVPSFHYAATSMMSTVYHRSGHIAVRWFLGDYALGIYAAAVRFVDILRNFASIGFNVLMPRMALSVQSPAGPKRLVNAAVSALAAVSIPLTLGTIFTAHLVVPMVLGANYTAAVSAVRWLAGFLLVAPLASLLSGTVLYSLGNYRACLISASAGALVAVSGAIVLIHEFGLTGACIAFVLGEFAVSAAAFFMVPRNLRDLWRNPFIGVAAVSALLMIPAVCLANSCTSRPWLVIGTGIAVYAVSAVLLGRKMLVQQFEEGYAPTAY
jgi:O-antigen/teichoic acid export membrane protein